MKDEVVVKENEETIKRTDSGIIDDNLGVIFTAACKGEVPENVASQSPRSSPQPEQKKQMSAQEQAKPRYPLSPTSLTLLNLTPPMLLAAVCNNLIDRFEFSTKAKTLLYVLTFAASAQSFSYTKGLLYDYKTPNNQVPKVQPPRHINLGRNANP